MQTFQEQRSPIYPPIARAAHVSGDVIVVATFQKDGTAHDVRAVVGPEMLKKPAIEFVQGWFANPDEGTRSCFIAIHYAISGDTGCGEDEPHPTPPTELIGRIDLQHYSVTAPALLLCDPAGTITRRKRFLGIF